MKDTDSTQPEPQPGSISRRGFLASAGSGIAAAGLAGCGTTGNASTSESASAVVATAPYDSLRDYVAMLDARGLVRRFDRVDQDAYEGTAIMYGSSIASAGCAPRLSYLTR